MTDDRFPYVLNIESEFLERHDAEHPHVLHRKECTYFADGVAETLPHVSLEVAQEWCEQYADRPYEEALVGFCQRCVVTPKGDLRPPLAHA